MGPNAGPTTAVSSVGGTSDSDDSDISARGHRIGVGTGGNEESGIVTFVVLVPGANDVGIGSAAPRGGQRQKPNVYKCTHLYYPL